MKDLTLVLIPVVMITVFFDLLIESKLKKKLKRELFRTFVGVSVIAYGTHNKPLLMIFWGLAFLLLLSVRKKSIAFREIAEKTEKKSGFLSGIVLYMLMVGLTIIIFPLWIAGCCLVNLSFADGLASMIGQRLGKIKLPWNKDKSWPGTLTFIAVSFLACFLVINYLNPMSASRMIALSLLASIVPGIIESLPVKIDDNITVPLITGIILFVLV